MKDTTIIIPARLNSTRLKRKLLLELGGKSILQRTFERCLRSKVPNKNIYIATDSDEILEHAKTFCKNVILTSKSCTSGTDRIAEASRAITEQFIVNVQGDEPFIDPNTINKLAEKIKGSHQESPQNMASVCTRIYDQKMLDNSNVVKVLLNQFNEAIYFSRLPVPFKRDGKIDLIKETYYRHIGVYAYKKDFLHKLHKEKKSFTENQENLEQLRALHLGVSIKMVIVDDPHEGVDTLEQYNRAKEKIIRY